MRAGSAQTRAGRCLALTRERRVTANRDHALATGHRSSSVRTDRIPTIIKTKTRADTSMSSTPYRGVNALKKIRMDVLGRHDAAECMQRLGVDFEPIIPRDIAASGTSDRPTRRVAWPAVPKRLV